MGLRDAVDPEKFRLARQMRNTPTAAEQTLWKELKGRALGFKFRRQAVIRGYIVDFYCPRAKLAIEVDGTVHYDQRQRDLARDMHIFNAGVLVIRFSNGLVQHKIGMVKHQIREAAFLRCKELGINALAELEKLRFARRYGVKYVRR